MDSHELVGRELLRKSADRLPQQISVWTCVDAHIVRGCLDPVHLLQVEENDATCGLNDQPLLLALASAIQARNQPGGGVNRALPQLCSCSLQGSPESHL